MKNTIALSLSLFFLVPSTASAHNYIKTRTQKWINVGTLALFTAVSGIVACQCASLINLDKKSDSIIPNLGLGFCAILFGKLAYDSARECKDTLDELV